MAREITLTESEMKELDRKLQAEKGRMSGEESQFLETLLNRAKAERSYAESASPGWVFSWTYRF
jgi:hypothetical protein